MNNKYLIWLKTEYKRAVYWLPLILKKAIILTVICMLAVGMIAFCTGKIKSDEDKGRLKVGYVTDKNTITDLAVAYVKHMDSVESLCRLKEVSGEMEGIELLSKGKLDALIILPDNVINEILSGQNSPAKLYLPKSDISDVIYGGFNAVAIMLFEELANAAVGMLETAQAQIYATSSILDKIYANEDIQKFYDDINRFNLNVVTTREDLFDIENVTVTGNDTYAVYFGSAVFTIYVLLAGLFVGGFCKRSRLEQDMAFKRLGINPVYQLSCRVLLCICLIILVMLFPFILFVIPSVNKMVSFEISWITVITFLSMAIFLAIYFVFIYQIVEKRQSALVIIGISALLQSYMSGCIIPSVLLPQSISGIGNKFPAAFIKAGFTAIFTGKTRNADDIIVGLSVWGIVLVVVTMLVINIDFTNENRHIGNIKNKKEKIHIPTIFGIMFRRLLYRKSMWLCMMIVVIVSVFIAGVEKKSQTKVTAAVYDEGNEYMPLLAAYDGIVCFESYDSEDAVKEAVLKGDAECGYILLKDLESDIKDRKANNAIAVYQDEDAVFTKLINEVIFEKIFRKVSFSWYKEYMMENINNESDCGFIVDTEFENQLNEGNTFSIEVEYTNIWGENKSDVEDKSTYPVFMVVVITILLCALQGILQVIVDIRENRFYKRNRVVMSALTIALPVLMGLVTGVVTMTAVFLLTL